MSDTYLSEDHVDIIDGPGEAIALLPAPAPVKGPLYLKDHGLIFDPVEHIYTTPDGEWYTGQSTIKDVRSKAWMGPWMLKEARLYLERCLESGNPIAAWQLKAAMQAHKAKSKDAMAIGTDVHGWIDAKRKGKPLPVLKTDAAKRGTEALLKWEQAHKVRMIASEVIVCSHSRKAAGTLDAIAEVDGLIGLGDYKAAKAIYEDNYLQTGAYQSMYEEMATELSPIIQDRFILRLGTEDGEFEFRWVPSPLKFDVETFWHLREVHKWNLYQERLKEEQRAGEKGK